VSGEGEPGTDSGNAGMGRGPILWLDRTVAPRPPYFFLIFPFSIFLFVSKPFQNSFKIIQTKS
jgi:hypothetical protein